LDVQKGVAFGLLKVPIFLRIFIRYYRRRSPAAENADTPAFLERGFSPQSTSQKQRVHLTMNSYFG